MGEEQDIGVRIAGDFLEGAGWEVIQLGASIPSASLAHENRQHRCARNAN